MMSASDGCWSRGGREAETAVGGCGGGGDVEIEACRVGDECFL